MVNAEVQREINKEREKFQLEEEKKKKLYEIML